MGTTQSFTYQALIRKIYDLDYGLWGLLISHPEQYKLRVQLCGIMDSIDAEQNTVNNVLMYGTFTKG